MGRFFQGWSDQFRLYDPSVDPKPVYDKGVDVETVDENADGVRESALIRAKVEDAMDSYDNYRMNRSHSEIFDAFGNPHDYWVRSTQERENRVYPTKPLVDFILNKTKLNGGWGQKPDAAARLHNAGFIIVDQDDQPIERPEGYEHLMEGADRIWICHTFVPPRVLV